MCVSNNQGNPWNRLAGIPGAQGMWAAKRAGAATSSSGGVATPSAAPLMASGALAQRTQSPILDTGLGVR